MARQLALIPAPPVLATDRPRVMLTVKPAPKPLARAVLQFDLVPIRRRSNKEVDEETRRRQMAADLAEYLADHPEMRPAIRSKRKKFSVPRSGAPKEIGPSPWERDR